MPTPIDPRRKPSDVKIHVSSGEGLDIVWSDGHVSHYDFVYLRDLCPCATCSDERRKKQQAPFQGPGTLTGSSALPLFKPKPRARAAKVVGHYALQIDFTDGHSTGIYSYDYLRTICPCQECAEAFREASSGE